MSAHRYWQINITSPSVTGLSEITFASTLGGTNLINPGVASVLTAQAGGALGAAQAFDHDTSTYWGSTGLPDWFQYDFKRDVIIREVTIQNINSGTSYGPATWDFQSSPDGSTWTTVQSYTSATWTALSQQTFAVPLSTARRYWRIFVNTTVAGAIVGIAELTMAESSGGPTLILAQASASNFQSGHEAIKAADGNLTTYWGSTGALPIWWAYDFGPGQDQDIVEVTLTDIALNSGFAPTAFDLQFSDDNSTWTTLQSFIPAAWSGGRVQTFDTITSDACVITGSFALGTDASIAFSVAAIITGSFALNTATFTTTVNVGQTMLETIASNPNPAFQMGQSILETTALNPNPTIRVEQVFVEVVCLNHVPVAHIIHMA